MFKKWLKSVPVASWEKLVAAPTLVGYKSTAAAIKSKVSLIIVLIEESRPETEAYNLESPYLIILTHVIDIG